MSLFEILSDTNDRIERNIILGRYLRGVMAERKVPLNVTFELLPVCNLNCQMCYIRMSQSEFNNSGYTLLRFDDWKYYIDEFVKLGTELFTFSGGECMLHPDFIQLYEYVYDLGKDITMITNGSCISDEIMELFIKKPPKTIFITVYGASKETYESFCGNGTAFEKVERNIDRLLSNKMFVSLISTISEGNVKDSDKIIEFANKRGLNVKFNGMLISFGKCDTEKFESVQIDVFKHKKNLFYKNKIAESDCNYTKEDFYKSYVFPDMDNSKINEKGLQCNASKSMCSVNWKGEIRPCVSFEPFVLDPRKEVGGVKRCWEKLVEWGDNVPQIVECQTCLFRNECLPCIARHYNDTHEFGKPSPRLCFKVQHPEEAAKLQAEYDRRQAEKAAKEKENSTIQGDL